MTRIPNIFHFINIGPREFNMLHFLSIYSAYHYNKPEKIYVYCDHVQENNIYYEILKDIVTYEFIDVPNSINNIPLNSYQYKADIIRMNKLIEKGGVYMDLDVISLKPIDKFLNYNIVMGSELSDDPNSTNINDFYSISNAIILAEPNNDFMKEWLKQIPDNIIDKPWAYHAVCLPKEILTNNDYEIHLEGSKTFVPFCFRKPYIFDNNKKHMALNLNESYTIHLWETIWAKDYISKFDIDYFIKNDNIFTDICRPYLKIIYDNKDKLETIINNLELNNDFSKLISYKKMLENINKLY